MPRQCPFKTLRDIEECRAPQLQSGPEMGLLSLISCKNNLQNLLPGVDEMKPSMIRFLSVLMLGIVLLTGCARRGSEFLGTWINTQNPNDSFEIVRNGDEYLIVSKGKKIGATYEKGMLEVKSFLGTTDLTYDQKTGTISTPGFLGQVEYRRGK